ncbi:hypothetical protein ACFU1R_20535 [Priestia megaterium]|uniref:hypothetical protein n=1 Tax=Priestia megaterium TaxID=1404 RepID=UPI00366BB001
MALIPLKQTATIIRQGEKDDWGNGSEPVELTLKCRAEETTATVQNQLGEESVSDVSFLFDKLPDIRYDDEISYTNELGVTVKRTPIKIKPIRMPNGKATLTQVYV